MVVGLRGAGRAATGLLTSSLAALDPLVFLLSAEGVVGGPRGVWNPSSLVGVRGSYEEEEADAIGGGEMRSRGRLFGECMTYCWLCWCEGLMGEG